MHYTYILRCADDTLYVGATNNLEKRLHEHNHAKNGAHYTKIRRPVVLLYSEVFETLKESRAREAELKRLSREKKLELVQLLTHKKAIMKSFQEKVIDVVKGIKKGTVMTYGEVARRAGNEKASRAVGTLMAKNNDVTVPCHRVVKSDGSIGMYNGLQGVDKSELLKQEGVMFKESGKVVM